VPSSEPLTILHVVRSPVGGIFRHIADLASAQAASGHAVGVVCDATTGGAFEEAHIARLAPSLAHGVTRVPMRRSLGPGDLGALRAVTALLTPLKPDVIHAHGAKGGVFGRLAAARLRSAGRPVAAFYAPHGGSLHYARGSAAGRLYFGVERVLERFTDALVHVSHYEARTYVEKVGRPACPAVVIHNGLRPEEFEPVIPSPDAADVLYIGMLRDLKGVDVFLAALARLAASGREATALVVGAGEPQDEARYRGMVEAAGLADRVRFHPPMPARQAFAKARAIVVPSRAESLPYIVLEAAAAGLPLLATRVGGIPEITEGERDRLLPPGDPAALSSALAAFLAAPERFRLEAAARRERLKAKFSQEAMVGSVERLYRAALTRQRAGDAGASLSPHPAE